MIINTVLLIVIVVNIVLLIERKRELDRRYKRRNR
jgi:hypothetical protein